MNRRTAAQQKGQRVRANGGSYRGGKTRQEQAREKSAETKTRRRENGTTLAQVSNRAAREQFGDIADYGVVGIVRDGYEWVVTMMSAADRYEKLDGSTEVRGRYALPSDRPRDGVELNRFDQKHEAVSWAGAECTTKVDAGEYVIGVAEGAKSRIVTVDKEEFGEFRRKAQKL